MNTRLVLCFKSKRFGLAWIVVANADTITAFTEQGTDRLNGVVAIGGVVWIHVFLTQRRL